RVSLITGDACAVFPAVERALDGNPNVMVIEDSLHSYENTLNVLERYAPVIGLGKYFVVEDGICHHGLDVGPRPGPYEAIDAFAGKNKNFTVDRSREPYCITWNPKGYMKRVA